MLDVYFERNGYAELVATFPHEWLYAKLYKQLLTQAKANGFDTVTESFREAN